MTLFITSFLAGILTILAPCILPVLPVVLAGSITEKKWWYPYVITSSLAISIVLFTVLLKVSTLFIDIPSTFWKLLSGGILSFLGLVYLLPHVWAKMSEWLGFSRAGEGLDTVQTISNPVFRAIATGAALGPIFSTCSPTYTLLLATVFPVSLIAGIGYTLTYTLGLASMLVVIAIGGRKIISYFRVVTLEGGWFKRILGGILVFIGISIVFGIDKKIEIWILDRFDIPSIEERILETILPKKNMQESIISLSNSLQTQTSSGDMNVPKTSSNLNTVISSIAPEIGLTEWIGSPRLTMTELRGKVVLIDFWTFGCINCQHMLPHLNAWYERYKSRGFEIIGVHAPEFAYEKVRKNVEEAVRKEKIVYPVVLDNSLELWSAYANHYWPTLYLIDTSGKVQYTYFGEGNYREIENAIEDLLPI